MSGAGKGHALGPVTPDLRPIVRVGPLMIIIYGGKETGKWDFLLEFFTWYITIFPPKQVNEQVWIR